MTLKTIAFAALAAATVATSASADSSYFSFQQQLDNTSTLELGNVTSQGAGVVEIYSFRGGAVGALLGTEAVNAGANTNVRVNIGAPTDFDVIALLKVDGETVASRDYEVDFR